jgi:hypothetical protein
MNYTAYNPQTGQLLWNYSNGDSEPQLEINNTPVIAANHAPGKFYWEAGNIIPIPDKPKDGFNVYNFDYATKTWALDETATAKIIRSIRDAALTSVDQVNPVWYASLTPDQQTELVTYRQALLDVPQQSGFPANVIWPTNPSWF